MKVAIISDIHENMQNLRLALGEIEKTGAAKIICLGDLISPGIAKGLVKSKIPVFSLWGNNDGESRIWQISLENGSNLTMSAKSYDFLEVDGRKIFINHFSDIQDSMAKSGDYNAVFYGHDHEKKKYLVNNCLVVNPGEIAGNSTGTASFAIYDTKTNDAEIIELKDAQIYKWN